jgi:hypothetical protein
MSPEGVVRRRAPRPGPWTVTTRTLIECLHCHDVCGNTVAHALRMGARHADDARVGALLDCADVCHTTALLIRRGSPLARRTAAVAAELCDDAAEASAALTDDPVMTACAESCRRCAAWCRRLGGAALERAA